MLSICESGCLFQILSMLVWVICLDAEYIWAWVFCVDVGQMRVWVCRSWVYVGLAGCSFEKLGMCGSGCLV